ncbi:hypothetical protein CF95_gp156 [Erwinia phage PhiEaH1]|jgi:hypothetical protein|uniref:Uncharacterized protein n=1 Tax=Erwinia phage PhiEaH1 TaxID=1401669 RepID=W8D0I6_9CAUD|nr:hypothetical protein CF95_gp156 [Erwinia phage PhiEaH1]AGX01878.1 hypothetical protein [Erwinia phage PhiEaH1]WBF04684.1 hypothetical protein [Erwinia phage vB_Ea277G]
MIRVWLLAICAVFLAHQVKAHAEDIPVNVPLIFHCELDAQHSVSIIDDADGPLYAFHKGDTTELAIYGNRTNVRYAYTAFSGGGGMYYRFIKGNISYVVYSATLPDGSWREGVKVYKDAKEISDKKCKTEAISNVPDYDPVSELPEDDRNDQMTYGF